MSHGEHVHPERDRPCWQCRHFLALTASEGAACLHGGRLQAQASPRSGCAFHAPDPVRGQCTRPQPVSFLDAWRVAPRHIQRPAEVLALMRQEFRVLVCTGDASERDVFAVLDRADRKRRITVVIHAGNPLARAWALRHLREQLDYADPMRGEPHAVIALPNAVDQVPVRQARATGLPVWAPDRDAVAMMMAAGEEGRAVPISGWRDGQQHQWSRDPGRGRRYR
jgi:hypothetical protein